MKNIKKIFDNKYLMVLDKPAGYSVHGDGVRKEETVSSYILKKFPKLKNIGESMTVRVGDKMVEIKRPGIVHRLDKDTSGCLIVAKNDIGYRFLKMQFQEHKIKKEYVALVWGSPKYETGIIDAKIAR